MLVFYFSFLFILKQEADARKILTASSPDDWRSQLGRCCGSRPYSQQDLKSTNISLNKAIDMAQNRQLQETVVITFGATQF